MEDSRKKPWLRSPEKIPQKNEKDLEDIDKTVRDNVKFIPCSSIFQVLDAAFAEEEVIAIIRNSVPSLVRNENKCKQCFPKN